MDVSNLHLKEIGITLVITLVALAIFYFGILPKVSSMTASSPSNNIDEG